MMNDNLTQKDAATAAAIAREIVSQIDEKGPLVNINHHYPKRGNAFEYGFYTCWGWISAISCAIALGAAIEWVLS